MLYTIIASEPPGALAAQGEAHAVHLERLRTLRDEGRLILAGMHPAVDAQEPGSAGFTGDLIVAEFESLHAASRWARDDPYLAARANASVAVRPLSVTPI
jgi:uncharacterized protein YciI